MALRHPRKRATSTALGFHGDTDAEDRDVEDRRLRHREPCQRVRDRLLRPPVHLAQTPQFFKQTMVGVVRAGRTRLGRCSAQSRATRHGILRNTGRSTQNSAHRRPLHRDAFRMRGNRRHGRSVRARAGSAIALLALELRVVPEGIPVDFQDLQEMIERRQAASPLRALRCGTRYAWRAPRMHTRAISKRSSTGCRPTAGFAISLKRWVARLVEATNIRETTFFLRDLTRLRP